MEKSSTSPLPSPFPFISCQPFRDDGSRNVSETGPKKKKKKMKEKQTQNRFWSGKREPIFRTFRYTGPPRQRWPLLVSFAACCCFGLESISVKGDTEVKVSGSLSLRWRGNDGDIIFLFPSFPLFSCISTFRREREKRAQRERRARPLMDGEKSRTFAKRSGPEGRECCP